MISTRDTDAIEYLHAKLPDVTMLFSVAWPDAEERVQSDPTLVGAIGGMTVFHGLVSTSFVTWAHEHHLLVLAWTVNDVARLNELVRLHVDGVTTANLAILQALS